MIEDKKTSRDVTEEYRESFRKSGYRKAVTVLRQFYSLGKTAGALQDYIYVSIGSNTGTEAQYILQNTPIPYAILIEKDSHACAIARKNLDPKRSLIINADICKSYKELQMAISDAQKILGVKGVLFSMQAVLHELPRRCEDFQWSVFFANILWDWEKCIFITREPCYPCNWPKNVELHIDGVTSQSLKIFGDIIKRKLDISDRIAICGHEYISTTTRLAIEIIHKALYIDDFAYEIEEASTDLVSEDVIHHIEKEMGKNSVYAMHLNSSSFCRNYHDLGISARTMLGKSLPMPLTFFSASAMREK